MDETQTRGGQYDRLRLSLLADCTPFGHSTQHLAQALPSTQCRCQLLGSLNVQGSARTLWMETWETSASFLLTLVSSWRWNSYFRSSKKHGVHPNPGTTFASANGSEQLLPAIDGLFTEAMQVRLLSPAELPKRIGAGAPGVPSFFLACFFFFFFFWGGGICFFLSKAASWKLRPASPCLPRRPHESRRGRRRVLATLGGRISISPLRVGGFGSGRAL